MLEIAYDICCYQGLTESVPSLGEKQGDLYPSQYPNIATQNKTLNCGCFKFWVHVQGRDSFVPPLIGDWFLLSFFSTCTKICKIEMNRTKCNLSRLLGIGCSVTSYTRMIYICNGLVSKSLSGWALKLSCFSVFAENYLTCDMLTMNTVEKRIVLQAKISIQEHLKILID